MVELCDVLVVVTRTQFMSLFYFSRTTDSLSTIQNGLPELIIEYNCGVEQEINERIIISLVIIAKVIVLVVAMVIAFDTRSLKFKKHRENVWVGISLYTVAVLGLIGIVCYQFILRQVCCCCCCLYQAWGQALSKRLKFKSKLF